MLAIARTPIASNNNENLESAHARLQVSRTELEEARAAHEREPGALTAMEVRFWTTTVMREEKLVEKLESLRSNRTADES